MKILYEQVRFKSKYRILIEKANSIIEDYAGQGLVLTVRQLYYQFVSLGLLENKVANYDMLISVVSKARRAGLIDWDAIVDRTRYLRSPAFWDGEKQFLHSVASQYRINPWEAQSCYVEIWFEKDALLGVFEKAAENFRLPLFSCRGYNSDSGLWESAQRLIAQKRAGKDCIVFHFGDHDPSGMDMSRDLLDRLRLFRCSSDVRRLALTMDQIEQYDPPPNPAKESDSRFGAYRDAYGDESWELDALTPQVVIDIVADSVHPLVDHDLWDASLQVELAARRKLAKLPDKWSKISSKW